MPPPPMSVEEAQVLKTKLEALGIAKRSGVADESIIELLQLRGIEFTGAVPVSLRLPKTETQGLEET